MSNKLEDVIVPREVFELLQLQAATILLLSKEQLKRADLEYRRSKLIQKRMNHEKRRTRRKDNRY